MDLVFIEASKWLLQEGILLYDDDSKVMPLNLFLLLHKFWPQPLINQLTFADVFLAMPLFYSLFSYVHI